MSLEISPDTFFLALISIFSGVAIPLIRKYASGLKTVTDRVELLEYIAVDQHPELVARFKKFKGIRKE